MTNIKSQLKRNRQNEKRRLRNRVVRGNARAAVKKVHALVETGNAESAKDALRQAISALDKAAEKGVLHKNNAARRKSRLMKKLAALPAQAQIEPPAADESAAVEQKPSAAKQAAPRKRTAAPKAEEASAVEKVEKVEESKVKKAAPAKTKKAEAGEAASKKPASKKSAAPKKS